MRYFFNLRESGDYIVDDEGRDLPDLDAARAAAVEAARSLIATDGSAGKLPASAVIEVLDCSGTKVLHVPFGDTVVLDGWRPPSTHCRHSALGRAIACLDPPELALRGLAGAGRQRTDCFGRARPDS